MNYLQKELFKEICGTKNLQEIQKYLTKVLEIRGFNHQSEKDKLILLVEEIGELAKAIRKSKTNIGIDYSKLQNYDTVESEVADVFIVLLSLCNLLNIDIYDAFISKERENINRVWKR